MFVPLDYRHHVAQIRYAVDHCAAKVLVIHRERLKEFPEDFLLRIPQVIVVGGEPTHSHEAGFERFLSSGFTAEYTHFHEEDDICAVIFTSGTTSRAKGVTLTRGAVEEGIQKYIAWVGLSSEDVALVAAPITRPMALRCQLLPMLRVGGRISLLSWFSPDGFVRAFQSGPPKTFISLLPAGLSQVVSHPEFPKSDYQALRLCICGGDRVPLHLHKQFYALTGVQITEQCGASEVGPYALNPPHGRKKPGSVGLPMYGAQVCLVGDDGKDPPTNEVGEIVVRSPMMMEGYWNDTALTRKTMRRGWVYTGDMGQFDEDGFLWFKGRKKDIIVSGGSNISPHEIETVLLEHPDIAQACVMGMYHEFLGQVPFAFVVGNSNRPPMVEQEIQDYCRERLAEYQCPESIEILESMPMKGPGKIDRDLLRIRGQIRQFISKTEFAGESLDHSFVDDVAQALQCKEYAQDRWIFRQGETGKSVYFLSRGKVEVIREDCGTVLCLLEEGCFFGELSMLDSAPRAASVQAQTDCEVLELRHVDALALADKYPRFKEHIEGARERYGSV